MAKQEQQLNSMTRYWVDDCPVRTHFHDAFSTLFPAWELAFSKIVAAYRADVTDLDLLRRMDEFIAQEMAHGKAHHAHNTRIGVTELEQAEFAKVQLVLRRPKMKVWLAAMVSIENIAAGLGRMFLHQYGNHTGREFALFRWHSVEELAHKSLAIDLWDALGHSREELARLIAPNRWYVVGFICKYIIGKLRASPDKLSFKLVAGVIWVTWRFGKIAAMSLHPARVGFHPDHIDDSALIQRYA